MLYALLSILICAIIAAAAYYASYHYVTLKHNREVIADELQRAATHIEELESRLALMEADKSMNEFKSKPKENDTGWDAFSVRR